MTDDRWNSEAIPILQIVGEGERADRPVNLEDVAIRAKLEPAETALVVERLWRAGYISGVEASSFDGFDLLDLRLTERGLRTAGEWPSDPERIFIESVDSVAAGQVDENVRDALRRLKEAAEDLPPAVLRATLEQPPPGE